MKTKTVKRLGSVFIALGMLQSVSANAGIMNLWSNYFGTMNPYGSKCTPDKSPTGQCIAEAKPPANLTDAQRAAWDAANPNYSNESVHWNNTTGQYDPIATSASSASNPLIPPTNNDGTAILPINSAGTTIPVPSNAGTVNSAAPAARTTNYDANGLPPTTSYGGPPTRVPCGPGSATNMARAQKIADETQKLQDTQREAERAADNAAACQIDMNSDAIKNAIPDALNGIASLVKSFDPAALYDKAASAAGGALAGLTANAAKSYACQASKNVLSGATRAVGNIAGQAANATVGKQLEPISNQINGVNNQIYGVTGQANQIQSNVPGGPYVNAPTVANPVYGAQNSAQKSTSGVFNSMSCRLFGQGCP